LAQRCRGGGLKLADGETKGERLDRELMELLQELRVVLPGVQVLLAFLLTAPFQQRFAQLPGSLRNAYFASIACATMATALLIAPSAHHRLRWRAGEKDRLLRIANREAIWGTVFLAAAIVLAMYVVTNVLFATWIAVLTAVVGVAVFVWLWYALPLVGRSSPKQKDEESEPAAALDEP
jgi:Kef-type K+ transport system membrane component KefB